MSALLVVAQAAPHIHHALASLPQRCLATARLVGIPTSHDTTIQHTNGCGKVRAFAASAAAGYHFGPWEYLNGARSHVHTLRAMSCGGWQGGNLITNRLWGRC